MLTGAVVHFSLVTISLIDFLKGSCLTTNLEQLLSNCRRRYLAASHFEAFCKAKKLRGNLIFFFVGGGGGGGRPAQTIGIECA